MVHTLRYLSAVVLVAAAVIHCTAAQAEDITTQAENLLRERGQSSEPDDTSRDGLYCESCLFTAYHAIYARANGITEYQKEVSKKQALNNGEAPPKDEAPQFNMEMSNMAKRACERPEVLQYPEHSREQCKQYAKRYKNAFDDYNFFMTNIFGGAFSGKTHDSMVYEYSDLICRRKLGLCPAYQNRHNLLQPIDFYEEEDKPHSELAPIAKVEPPLVIDKCSVCISLMDILDILLVNRIRIRSVNMPTSKLPRPERLIVGETLDTLCDSVAQYFDESLWREVRKLCADKIVDDHQDEIEAIFSSVNPHADFASRARGVCIDTTSLCTAAEFQVRLNVVQETYHSEGSQLRFGIHQHEEL